MPEELVLHLDGIQGPRIGSSNKDDEPFAFEARQFVIDVAVGKLIDFEVTSTAHSLHFGRVSLPDGEHTSQDLSTHILRNGWAKLRQSNTNAALQVIQDHSKQKQRGLWGVKHPRSVAYTMPADLQSFIDTHSHILPGVVEQVRDGHTVRLRLLLSGNTHQYITLALAGARSPKVGRDDIAEPAEDFGAQSKLYVESKCLQRKVSVRLFSTNQSASIALGSVTLDDGSALAECVLANGFAKFADWHAATLAAHGSALLPALKVAEKFARENRLNVWQAHDPVAVNGASTSEKSAADVAAHGHIRHPRQSEVIVTRVWSGDQLSVVPLDKNGRDGVEKRVQIASVRQPRSNDPKQAYWAQEARELIRKKLIGRRVIYQHDYTRPKEDNYDEREAATIRFGAAQQSIGLLLVERGLVSVVRHRRDDDRSHEYDALLVAEQTALASGKALHSNKELPLPRIPDASESASKAQSFLPQWKRSGRISGVVEYVASGSRFKIYIPKDNQKLTLVLAGLKAPRTARNASEKSEEGGVEALEYANRQLMQRDVEVSVEGADKAGGFIGTLYINNDNYGVGLVRKGLASVHEYSAEGLPFADELFEAEEQAREGRVGVWKNYDPVAEQAAEEAQTQAQEATKEDDKSSVNLIDVLVSDVRSAPHFSFSVQLVGSDDSQKFERCVLRNPFVSTLTPRID